MFDNANFPFSTWQTLELRNDHSKEKYVVEALRVSYAGELGWELHIPIANNSKKST